MCDRELTTYHALGARSYPSLQPYTTDLAEKAPYLTPFQLQPDELDDLHARLPAFGRA
jgi:hypothetical protein